MVLLQAVEGDTKTGQLALKLQYDTTIAPAKGLSQEGRTVIVPGLPSADEFSGLVHETAHQMLHRDERRKETTRTIRETEAEAVAFVVCQAIGLDTNTAACDYIKLYNGDAATLSASCNGCRPQRQPF